MYEVTLEPESEVSGSGAADPEAAAEAAEGGDGSVEAAAREVAVAEFGSKIAALVAELGPLHAQGGKAVVFSAWTRLLSLAGDALQAHGVPTASLVGSPAAKRAALAAFAAPGCGALLVPLFGGASGAGGGGAAGLTLTQAEVAVLLEPALQPGIERQAAGRIARIGQPRATRCVRLVVQDTIEPKILDWQQIRLADGASANPSLSLNDFAQLAL